MKTLQEHRINLHRIPEIGFNEFKTQAYILSQLQGLSCNIHTLQPTGLVVYFPCPKKEAKTIGFRADMDALPVTEETGLSFSSEHPGMMHACGHDAHCAILIGLAHYIHEHIENMSTHVVLIFQPSEENEAGAHVILQSGWLEKYHVSAIFGLHLWPGLPFGTLHTRADELMAASSETDIMVHGKASHIANADQAIDALYIATQLIQDLYLFEKNQPETVYRLLKFGKLEAGTVRNVVANQAHLQGSLRTFYPNVHAHFKAFITQTAQKYEAKTGCTININYNDGYEAVLNDKALFQWVTQNIPYVHALPEPVMQAEDFGLYRRHCPLLFCFLGVGDVPPLHANNFNFNMDVLDQGLRWFIDLIQLYG